MSTATTPVPAWSKTSSRGWEQIGNFIVLVAYSGVVLFTVRYHEKWADEAQAWLLARDLSLKALWFHELSYEGAPGLWHTVLWLAQRVFHAPYNSIGYIGAAFAIGGATLLIFKAPFPWYVRWPLAFTYFMVYQYAVIARPYTLLPLLCFSVAILFNDIRHPLRITAALVLLANLSLHGTILAACFGLFYLLQAITSRSFLSNRERKQYFLGCAVMIVTFAFLVAILKPTPDNAEFAEKHRIAGLSDAERQRLDLPTARTKFEAIVSGALLDSFWPSMFFLCTIGAWSLTRSIPGFFILPIALLIALYAVVHGYAHHHGTVFVAVITGLWVLWPREEEQRQSNSQGRLMLRGVVTLLLCLCGVNIWDAAVVIRREYLYPYSGAEDAAAYLKAVHATEQPLMGYLFGIVAVQAYFPHNIFANTPNAYFHLAFPFTASTLDVDEIKRIAPEYIVTYSIDPQVQLDTNGPTFASLGYSLVHFSDGYYLYKQGIYQREAYLIFRHIHPTGEQTPQPVGPDK